MLFWSAVVIQPPVVLNQNQLTRLGIVAGQGAIVAPQATRSLVNVMLIIIGAITAVLFINDICCTRLNVKSYVD